MKLPQLPARLRTEDRALFGWLNVIQGILSARFFGKDLQKAVTFKDLVDLGLVDRESAQRQAEG